MEKLIEFFENKCLEPKLYWRVKTRTRDKTFELEWHRDRRTKWHLRSVPQPGEDHDQQPWDVFETEQLTAKLIAVDIDPAEVESKIKSTTLQQVVFAKMMVDDAHEFFGEEVVAEAVEETQQFLSELRNMVSDLVVSERGEKSAKRNIRLVKN